MENRSRCVQRLQLVLNIQRREDVLRVADRQVGGVGIVGSIAVAGSRDDVREALLVVLGKAIGGRLGGRCLQVVQVAVHFLIIGQTLPHMIQHRGGKLLRRRMCQILADPVCVEARLIHADQSDRREVVGEGAEVTLGVGIQSVLHQLGDDAALDLERPGRDIHQPVEAAVEVLLVGCLVGNAGHIDGDNTHRTGGLTASEEAAGFLAQLAQVKAQAAAHGTDIGRLHIAVDIVGEIRCAVLGGHFKQQPVIFSVGPVKIAGDGIGGDGILEAAAVGIALNHGFDERLIDDVHLVLAVLILEVHFLAADYAVLLGEVGRDNPVQRDVGEGCLRAPPGRSIDAEDEGFDALLDGIIAHVITLDKGGEVCIEGRERLCACPLILHDAEEIDHLVAQRCQMLGGCRGDLAGHTAQSLLDQLLERPPGAIAGQHGEVVQMDVRVPVRIGDLLVVNLAQPVVGGNGAGVGQDQTADRIGHGGILLDAPVIDLEVVVHNLLVVQQRIAHIAHTLTLLTIQDICLGDLVIARLNQDRLHAVLNILHRHPILLDLGLEIGRDLQRQKVDGVIIILQITGIKRLNDCIAYLAQVEIDNLAVPFDYCIHTASPLFLCSGIRTASGSSPTRAPLLYYTILVVVCQAHFYYILCQISKNHQDIVSTRFPAPTAPGVHTPRNSVGIPLSHAILHIAASVCGVCAVYVPAPTRLPLSLKFCRK